LIALATDEALKLVFKAASAVPYAQRKTWLQKVARRMERINDNERLKRCRERRKHGLALYTLTLDEVSTELLMEQESLLPTGVDHTRAEVNAALTTFIAKLCELTTRCCGRP
jgi:hypothetical protein